MTYMFLTFKDASKETAGVSLNLETMLPDGTNTAAVVASYNALVTAIDAFQTGELKDKALLFDRVRVSNTTPTTGDRELKWMVRYEDDVTKKVHYMEIPNANRAHVPMYPGTDFVDLGSGNALTNALIAAVNTHLRSPAGNDCTLLDIEIVGRNL